MRRAVHLEKRSYLNGVARQLQSRNQHIGVEDQPLRDRSRNPLNWLIDYLANLKLSVMRLCYNVAQPWIKRSDRFGRMGCVD